MRIGQYASRLGGKWANDPTLKCASDPADHYAYMVFYNTDAQDFVFLAAFTTHDKAQEYASRLVWQYLKPYVSRQPVY